MVFFKWWLPFKQTSIEKTNGELIRNSGTNYPSRITTYFATKNLVGKQLKK